MINMQISYVNMLMCSFHHIIVYVLSIKLSMQIKCMNACKSTLVEQMPRW